MKRDREDDSEERDEKSRKKKDENDERQRREEMQKEFFDACKDGTLAVVRRLLANDDVDVNAVHENGVTALH